MKFVDLSYNLISDIDTKSFILPKLNVLLLTGNQLKELPGRSFVGLNRLETLDLSANQISTIHREAFFGLLNLKHLRLHSNRLKQVPTLSFFHLQCLATLNMADNNLNNLAELSFSPLSQLHELSLDSNHISRIHNRAFVHLPNLTVLNLENNRLFQVPSDPLSVLSNLEMLTLSRNILSVMMPNAFRGLTQLRTLVISNSPLSEVHRDALLDNGYLTKVVMENNRQLSRIEPGTFLAQSNSLVFLSLRANRISTLQPGTVNLQRIKQLDLKENPLVCNCSIHWLAEYFRSSNHSSLLNEQIRCHRPASHAGKPLVAMSRADLSCPQMESPLKWMLSVIGLMMGLIVTLLLISILVCRHRHTCFRDAATTRGPCVEHSISNDAAMVKSRMDHSLYYPAIINEDFARDKQYHGMHTDYQTMTSSTRAAAYGVHFHRPYVPIAHL